MDVIVINNSYHIHSKVNVGAGASQKREAPISNIQYPKRKCQYSIFNKQKIKSKVKCQMSKMKIKSQKREASISKENIQYTIFNNQNNTK